MISHSVQDFEWKIRTEKVEKKKVVLGSLTRSMFQQENVARANFGFFLHQHKSWTEVKWQEENHQKEKNDLTKMDSAWVYYC
mmetsp:Transcript_19705/g.44737  ORF Transcript_19705/g.44737 Transcript_19705/m.44737 type:complete len:82 (-) Transcript_19705:1126-1371(-)